jgi:hypothetical protein
LTPGSMPPKICSDGRADVDHARLRSVLGK